MYETRLKYLVLYKININLFDLFFKSYPSLINGGIIFVEPNKANLILIFMSIIAENDSCLPPKKQDRAENMRFISFINFQYLNLVCRIQTCYAY